MAVTLEGTFRILDRASPAMRGMERQALKTDAAITKLGASLDALGTNAQLKKLDNVNRNVRTLGNESQTAEKKLRSSGREVESTTKRVERMGGAFTRAGIKVAAFSALMKPAMWLGMATAVGVLVQAVGALSGGVIALLPRMSDLAGLAAPAVAGIAGIGVAAIATKLAMSDLTKAYSGNKAALKGLTPEARAFLHQLKAMKPVVKELRQAAQEGLFPGLSTALTRAKAAAPSLRPLLRQGGAAVGGAAARLATAATSSKNIGDLTTLAQQGFQIIGRGTTVVMNLLDVLRNFGLAARPFTDWLTTSIVLWSKHRAAISEFNKDSGKTAAFLDRTRVALTGTVHIVESLWANLRILGQAARPLGDLLWKDAERGLGNWTKLHSTVASRQGLTAQFLRMRPAIEGIVKLVSDLGAAIFRMGSSGGLPKTVSALDKLVPSLEKTLNFLADTFGPPLANALTSIGNLATSLTGAAGPFTLMADLLAKVLNLIAGLTNAVPGLGRVFSVALDVFLIQRFLVKLGLLRAGWLGVAGAARVAGAAEAAAMAGGAAGGAGRGGRVLGALGNLGFGFALARAGGKAGGLGKMAGLGGLLGAGRVGGALAGAGRLAKLGSPVGLGAAALGLGVQFMPVGNTVKSIGSDAAMGAGIGATVGSIVPGVGTLIGAGVGGLAGTSFGLLHAGLNHSDSRPAHAQAQVTSSLAALGAFPSQIGRLTAELAIYQRAQRSLAGDRSAAAQQELASLQAEIQSRRSVIAQLRAERMQRRDASRSRQAANAAVDLGHLFDLLTRSKAKGGAGMSRAAALRRVDLEANARLSGMHGVARHNLGKAILMFGNQIGKGNPAAAKAAAVERAFIAEHFPELLPVTARDRKITGAPGELGALQRGQKAGRSTEAEKQRLSKSRTAMQDAVYRWFLAHGLEPKMAAAAIQATDGTTTMPRATPGNSSVPAKQAGFLDALKLLTPKERADILRRMQNPKANPAHGKHASGGRIGGGGLNDHVPLGGIAAPGELVINRHQEALADRMMGRRGALSALTQGFTRKHSDFMAGGFAKGGRVTVASGIDTADVNRQLLGDVNRLAAGVGPVTITSGFRTGSHQADLYAAYVASGFDPRHIAAKPGLSAHEYGLAVDALVNGSPAGNIGNATLAKYGLVAPVGGDPVHLELAANSPQLLGLSVALGRAGKFARGIGASAASVVGASAGAAKVASGRAGGVAGGGLDALTFAGAPGATGHAGAAALAAANIMGFIPFGGGAAAARPAKAKSGAGLSSVVGSAAAGPAQAMGRRMMLKMGWGADQWGALQSLWNGESGWRFNALNASSGAYGIPQSLPASKMASAGADWKSNPATQIRWGLDYIRGRYGSPSAAYSAWQGRSPHWYGGGGRVPAYAGAFENGGTFRTNGPTMFMAGDGKSPKETVTVSKGHGHGGASLTIQNLTIHAGDGNVKDAVLEALESAWDEFASHIEREAAV